MKKTILAVLLLLSISITSFSNEFVTKGKTYGAVGDYKIESADSITINGEQLKSYLITYQNSPLEVTVAIKKQKGCKTFIVLSEQLSVKYVYTKNRFGVEKLDIKKDGYETSDNAMNRTEYYYQKLITSDPNNNIDNVKMIAAYFHALIKS